MALFSIAPAPVKEEVADGFLAIPSTPNAVELGLMACESDMDRRPGISAGRFIPGSSSGVVACELYSESGELGLVTSCCSSGVAGLMSEPLMAGGAE
jgi:hypothetical protein